MKQELNIHYMGKFAEVTQFDFEVEYKGRTAYVVATERQGSEYSYEVELNNEEDFTNAERNEIIEAVEKYDLQANE